MEGPEGAGFPQAPCGPGVWDSREPRHTPEVPTQNKGGGAAHFHSLLLRTRDCPVWGAGFWRLTKKETFRAGHQVGEGLGTEQWVRWQGPSALGREVSPDARRVS